MLTTIDSVKQRKVLFHMLRKETTMWLPNLILLIVLWFSSHFMCGFSVIVKTPRAAPADLAFYFNNRSEIEIPPIPHRHKRDLSLLHGIYPGTKWCGKGNVASGPNDFGELVEVDMCCMKHDNCPMSIMPGERKHGITNNGFYPISHCGCDDEFFSCLKDVGSSDAQFLGEIYFNILGMKCFVKEHPRTCIEWHWWGTCKKYKENRNQKPVVQLMTPRNY